MQTALIKCAIAPLYQNPEHRMASIDEVLYGMKVELLEERGEWWYVRTHYRYEGYLHRHNLLFQSSKICAWEQAERGIIIKNHADILAAPSYQAYRLTCLPKGAQVIRLEQPDEDGFVKVGLVDGRIGFLRKCWMKAYVKSIYEDEYEKLRKMTARLKEEPKFLPSVYIDKILGKSEQEFRDSVIKTALSYLGISYRWGGKTTLGIDCSGLCQMAYLLNGLIIYRDSCIQDDFPIRRISLQQKNPGDLLFAPGHVAIYLGEEQYIHSTGKNGRDGVVIESLDPCKENYREDLAASFNMAGTVF